MTIHDSQYSQKCPRPPLGSPRYGSDGWLTVLTDASSIVWYDGHSTRDKLRPTYKSPRHQPYDSAIHGYDSSVPIPKATQCDARNHCIPTGYSLKNWDPREKPILLLGSVFDVNSIGKWIYNWTIYPHGPDTPMCDMANELWLLLIHLGGRVKRSEEAVSRIYSVNDRDLIEAFIEEGKDLIRMLSSLLRACEAPMIKVANRSKSDPGKNAGIKFVESIFGRDQGLEKTENFMQAMRLFNSRFDAHCEEVLRDHTA